MEELGHLLAVWIIAACRGITYGFFGYIGIWLAAEVLV